MQDFGKAVKLVKWVEAFGMEIRFIASGWRITQNDKLIIQGADLDRLQYFVEGMKYGSDQVEREMQEVREGGPGEPLFVEGTDDELAEEVNRLEKACVKLETERDKWKKSYNRIRSRVRRAGNKVWIAVCPNDDRYALVTVGATKDAASEAMMFELDHNEDVERVYFEQKDIEPETKRDKEFKKENPPKGKKKRKK